MIKKLVFLILGIVVLALVVALFLPGSYTVERSIEIARPPEVVYPLVAEYENWLQWSPWPKMDPEAKQTITGTPGMPGHSWSWEGEVSGVGSMTVVEAKQNESVQSKLVFVKPMTSEADDWILLERTDTRNPGHMEELGSLPYPVGRYFGLGLEGMLGPQFEEGLSGVKSLAESVEEEPAPPALEETGEETEPSTIS